MGGSTPTLPGQRGGKLLSDVPTLTLSAGRGGKLLSDGATLTLPAQRGGKILLGVIGLGLLVLGYFAVVRPYLADQYLMAAVQAQIAGHQANARSYARQAWDLSPQESVYATEVGNIAFDDQDWRAARDAYDQATALGTFNPRLFRNLAVADRNLGLRQEAIKAAQQAVYLDRFDPANQALLAQMLSSP